MMFLFFLGFLLIMIALCPFIFSEEFQKGSNYDYEDDPLKLDEFDMRLIDDNVFDNAKCKVLGEYKSYSLIYTNIDELYLVSKSENVLNKIEFDKVLDVKIEYDIKEKNTMKLVSIAPTFNKHTTLKKCTLKLILDDKTHEFLFIPNKPSDGGLKKRPVQQNINDVVDSMERMRLLIERKIK